MNEGIKNLRAEIETALKCKAAHERSAKIEETFRDEIVLEGIVESFVLTGHPKAKRCYACKGETRYVNVLEIPPVDSPQTAVKVAILRDSKERYRVKSHIQATTFQRKKIEFDFNSYEYGHEVGTGILTVSSHSDGKLEITIMADPELGSQKRLAFRLSQTLVDAIKANPVGSQFRFLLKN